MSECVLRVSRCSQILMDVSHIRSYPLVRCDNGVVYTENKNGESISVFDIPESERFFKVNVMENNKNKKDFDMTEEEQDDIYQAMRKVTQIKGLSFVSLYVPKLMELLDIPTLQFVGIVNSRWGKHLHLLSPSVEEFVLTSSGLTDENIIVLCNTLKRLKNLKRLILKDNRFNLSYIKMLFISLLECTSLETVRVEEHQDPHWNPIIPFNPSSKELDDLRQMGSLVTIKIGGVTFGTV